MASVNDVVEQFKQLDDAGKRDAAQRMGARLGEPPDGILGALWLIVVTTFAVVLVGGVVLLFILVSSNDSTEVIGPIVTAALGVLAGLLAPSPVKGGR